MRTWSTSKPEKPGWYWIRGGMDEHDPTIIYVFWQRGELRVNLLTVVPSLRLSCLTGEFAGPLEPPSEVGR